MLAIERKKLFEQVRLAQSYYYDEKFTQAFNLISKIEKNNENNYLTQKLTKLKVNCLIQVGNIQSACEYIEELVSRWPISSLINYEVGVFYHQIGDFERANKFFLRAICLSPERVDFALGYAQFLRERNSHSQALSVLSRCLKINRRSNRGLTQRLLRLECGLIYYYQKKYYRAKVFFVHIKNGQPNFHYLDLLADCYLHLQKYGQAVNTIELHLQQWGENDADALYLYAKGLAADGRSSEAKKILEKCIKLSGELFVSVSDLLYLYPLLQDGSLKKMGHVTIEV